jgi:short-subunit dehydrogenase involved in D-alanine esterification of teichoic acids
MSDRKHHAIITGGSSGIGISKEEQFEIKLNKATKETRKDLI